MITVAIEGIDGVEKVIDRIDQGAQRFGRIEVIVGSQLPYAYGIETGWHRGGTLARRAGGVFYLKRGLESVQGDIGKSLIKGLADGPGGAEREMLRLGRRVEARAKEVVVVKSGDLRGSIHTRFG